MHVSKSVQTCLVAAAVVFTSGCAALRVQKEAAVTLECESVSVSENREYKSWVADGCGRRAICALPDVPRAEFTCSGCGPEVASTGT